jgi:peptidoglycan/LPS O-acetylase OafA/YrhL
LATCPQYFAYLAFAAFLIFVLGIRSDLYQSGPLTAENVIAHLSVVPLSAFMYLPEVGRLQLLPQAWSLGTEALFYLSLPFLLVSRWRVYACIVFSFIIFLIAIAGALDPDAFGFRLLPGVLIFFLTGHLIFRRDWRALCLMAVVMIVGGAFIGAEFGFDRGYNRSVYVGAAIGVLGVLIAMHMHKNSIDDLLGAASYGCYLSHFALIFMFAHYGWLQERPRLLVLCLMTLSLAAGLISDWLVERPTISRRRRFRVGAGGAPGNAVSGDKRAQPELARDFRTLLRGDRIPEDVSDGKGVRHSREFKLEAVRLLELGQADNGFHAEAIVSGPNDLSLIPGLTDGVQFAYSSPVYSDRMGFARSQPWR